MQGSYESAAGPQTSHYARDVHTSHNEAFAIELNTYSELGKCLDNDELFSVIIFEMIRRAQGSSVGFKLRLFTRLK